MEMKRIMVVFAVVSVLGSCGRTEQNKETENKKEPSRVFAAYLNLRDTFFNGRPGQVKAEAEKLKQEIAQVKPASSAAAQWTEESARLSGLLDQMAAASNIEEQRKFFAGFSEAFYKDIRDFHLAGGTIYLQHCPMALDGKGANWVSDRKEIHNPYMGEEMPECGEVLEEKQL